MNRTLRLLNWDEPLPANVDAERLVLGSILSNPGAFELVNGTLHADDFSIEKHKRIFLSMRDLSERGEFIDRVTLYNDLGRKGQTQSVDGMSYIVSLDDGLPFVHNLEAYVNIVREKSILRNAIVGAHSLILQCLTNQNAPSELLGEAERVTEILNANRQPLAIRTVEAIIAEEGGINQFLSPDRMPGIPIPFSDINATLSGLRPSKLIILGARPAVGKTALVTQMAEHAAASGRRVLLVTLEMSARDILHRLIAGRARVSAYKFRNGLLADHERNAIQSETANLLELDDKLLILDKSNTTVQGIANLLRTSAARGQPVDLCVIDYLQLLNAVGSFENRVQEVSKISRELKRITQGFRIPVIALSQLKRTDEHRKNERPELDWLKESGQLEQDADQVLFLWVKREPEEGNSVREVSWRIAKNRDGILNQGSLTFRAKYCRFDESESEEQAIA